MRRPNHRPLVIGHQNLSDPNPKRNSLSDFRSVLETGADGIECDVRLGRDGVLFCCHDTMLRNIPAESLSADQRKAADVDELFPVINLATDYEAGVLLEFKSREAAEKFFELVTPAPNLWAISFSDAVVCEAVERGFQAVMLDGTSAEVLRDLTPKGAMMGPSWQVALSLRGPELDNSSVWKVDDLGVAQALHNTLAITTNFPSQMLRMYGA